MQYQFTDCTNFYSPIQICLLETKVKNITALVMNEQQHEYDVSGCTEVLFFTKISYVIILMEIPTLQGYNIPHENSPPNPAATKFH